MKIAALSYSCSRVLGFLPKYKFYFFFFRLSFPLNNFSPSFLLKMIELVVRKPGNSKTTKRITQKENN